MPINSINRNFAAGDGSSNPWNGGALPDQIDTSNIDSGPSIGDGTQPNLEQATTSPGGSTIPGDSTITKWVVKVGDTFWDIAKKQLGSGASDVDIQRQTMALMQANSGVDPRQLQIGQSINLVAPGSGGTISAETTARYNESDRQYREYLASHGGQTESVMVPDPGYTGATQPADATQPVSESDTNVPQAALLSPEQERRLPPAKQTLDVSMHNYILDSIASASMFNK